MKLSAQLTAVRYHYPRHTTDRPGWQQACYYRLSQHFRFRAGGAGIKQIEEAGIIQNDAIPYLSIYLGHDSLNETEKYLKFSSEAFPEDMDLFETYISAVWSEVSYEE